jgi:predicted phage tail protein
MSATVPVDVVLSGVLGKRFGRKFSLAVGSPAEAVRALCAMVKGFEQYLMESESRGMRYHVFADDENIPVERLRLPSGKRTIRFAPVMVGRKSGALAAIAGVVLIVVGVFLLFTPFAPAAGYIIGAGIGLLAMGVAQMLAPKPPAQEKDTNGNKANQYFNGPVNTAAQGNPVSLFYGGPAHIGSAVISASITTEDGVYVPQPTPPSQGGGGGGSMWAQLLRQMRDRIVQEAE